MSPCPWGHQQTATLRLEDPRAQGGGIILACFTLRSPKSREWVQASFSEPNSCCQTGTKRKAARGTEEALCYSVLFITHRYEHFIHSLFSSESGGLDESWDVFSAGHLRAPCSLAAAPKSLTGSVQSSNRAVGKPSATMYPLVNALQARCWVLPARVFGECLKLHEANGKQSYLGSRRGPARGAAWAFPGRPGLSRMGCQCLLTSVSLSSVIWESPRHLWASFP